MADLNTISSVGSTFWKRPEGKVGTWIPIVGLAIVLWFFGGTIGDYIVNAFDNMLHLILVGLCIGAILACMFVENIRIRFFYLYKSLMRLFTGIFIDIDPIGILKTYKERMGGKLKEMLDSLSALKGQRQKSDRRKKENSAALENEYRLLKQAQKVQDQSQLSVHGKQVTRLTLKDERYTGEMNRLNLLIGIMERYYHLCEDTITDMGNEITFREEEKKEARESRGAVRSAMAILKGLPEKDMWDEATTKLEADYTAALGEVDSFLDVTKNILQTADLQDGADAEKAMALLDNWQNKNANVSLGGSSKVSKATIIRDATNQIAAPSATINLGGGKPQYAAIPVNTSSGDDDYLKLVQ